MPNATEHVASRYQKILYIGDSSTGKTGSLTSLIAAGYRIGVLDLDNGLQPLVKFVKHECPDNLKNLSYQTFRDKYKATSSGPIVSGSPKAYVNALKAMELWDDESDPAEWGEDSIFVIDTFDSLGKAAFEWAKGMNPSAKDPRQWFFSAQQSLENVLQLLTGEQFMTNVIVISHVNYKEAIEGVHKGHAAAIGSALGPSIPKYFNTLILAESSGVGKNVRRRIKTAPTGIIDLKNPVPFELDAELPLESGMATIFEKLKGE